MRLATVLTQHATPASSRSRCTLGLRKLEEKIGKIAARELAPDGNDRELAQKRSDLTAVERDLATVGRNMALAGTVAQHAAVTKVFDQLEERQRNLRGQEPGGPGRRS